jgi:streptomycin 6-kinase
VKAPAALEHLRGFPGGAEWLERLPRLVAESLERWSLDAGEPFPYAHVSVALPARLPDGADVVLKVAFPHWESEHEAAALGHWDGRGAVRLLDYDGERNALLLERCLPGTSLLELPEEAGYRIAAQVLPLRWERPAPPEPFTPIAGTAARWADELPERWERAGRPFERAILDAAVAALRELPPSQPELVVCHQDLHRGNILLSARGWLAIDPKPVAAERAFDTAALLRDGPGRIEWRLDLLAALLGLDRERMRGWGIAHAIAWGFDEYADRVHENHVGVARALLRAKP